uniref:PEP-CTERM protein-sorting domain-containing protein n=1 Tax=Candidatus Methanophagaceae archaeon ANME-1 ERB6 TaxID=2759912 RepID=A0A7G9YYY6_9EURY|nr:hypothetical protein HNLOENAD_00020 [Methanosarcinales archaeon ANME-1 ERB6]
MIKGIVVVVLAAALLVSMVGVASAAAPQIWYLDNETHTVTGKTMEKTIGTQSGNVTIPVGGSQIWLAGNDAECDVTFPSGAWVIETKTALDEGKCTIQVGRWDTSTGWNAIPTTTAATVTWTGHILKVELQTGSATIEGGDYLALKIENDDTAEHTVDTDGSSSLRSPDTDPGYPVPELPTIVLTSVGLLALAGYVEWRRKKR